MNNFKAVEPVAPPPAPSNGYGERQFLHTLLAGVGLPLAQAFTTGGIVFLVGLVLAFNFNALDPWRWPLTLGALTTAGMWVVLQRRWLNLTRLERFLGMELDGIPNEPPVKREPTVIRIDHVREGGRYQSDRVTLPADESQLRALAEGFAAGRPFSEREWAGAGKPFASQEFRELRAAMLRAGLIQYKNPSEPRQGFNLTEDGVAWRNKYADPSPTVVGEVVQ